MGRQVLREHYVLEMYELVSTDGSFLVLNHFAICSVEEAEELVMRRGVIDP